MERPLTSILPVAPTPLLKVADAMAHGGPYPASTHFGATFVGTMSNRRFLRPVCFQDVPAGLLDL